MNRAAHRTLDTAPSIRVALEAIDALILGKDQQTRLAVTCLLARGHLLIEDRPGMGKTTLAQALARVFDLGFARVQFTADLLPSDILGVSVYQHQRFEFQPGPIFSHLVLADEINRASPKTQSALLEAMEEDQVTVEGETRALPRPFFVVATQNPADQAGTFPLPESQLDRFLMNIHMGYPPAAAERALLGEPSRRHMLRELSAVLTPEALAAIQSRVADITTSAPLLDYVVAVITHSRTAGLFRQGLSPRAGLALRRAAQAWAFLADRDHVLPEDVQAVLPAVVDHRLAPADTRESDHSPGELLRAAVPVP